VVALDLVATIAIGFIVVHAVASRQPVLLAPALALALLAFLGTVTFAYYIGRRK
jgi:multicomponent Na+:H+ antiporter subunit F